MHARREPRRKLEKEDGREYVQTMVMYVPYGTEAIKQGWSLDVGCFTCLFDLMEKPDGKARKGRHVRRLTPKQAEELQNGIIAKYTRRFEEASKKIKEIIEQIQKGEN